MSESGNPPRALDLRELYAGRRLVVVGGTGFLGKVFWTLLLDRFPDVGHVYLLVRPKGKLDAEERFWKEIASSSLLGPLRERLGDDYESFLRERVTPVAGDVAQLYCGIHPELRNQLRGGVDAVINAAGVVEFDPPLDVALEVNAFGVQNLVSLARDLGDCPVFHTSTCFVAGSRTGFVEETNPLDYPFPRAHELDTAHWEADREIRECLDVIRQAKQRADDAFRQSHFVDLAKRNLEGKGAPTYGAALEVEIQRVRRKYVEARLAEMGRERAQFWGWANTYTYTKSLGEQIVASSGLPFTIGRPAIIESTVRFPFPGWNEGINTSAPLIYALRSGQPQLPGSDNHLDIIPCDMVASGMLLSVAELIEGRAPAVYQYGSSDTNPVTMARIFELSGLYKRRYHQKHSKGGLVGSFVQSRFEGSMLSSERFEQLGPRAMARASGALSSVTRRLARGAARPLLSPVSKKLEAFSRSQEKVGNVLAMFAPFTAEYDYIFRCDNTRAALARVPSEQRSDVDWSPESIDWRRWFLDVHVPALETWVFPELERRLEKSVVAPQRHETLPSLLDDMASRMQRSVALCLSTPQGLARVTYGEWRLRSLACARRLRELGVGPGDRVVIAAHNHPEWPIAFFGIQYAGAAAVPVDAGIEGSALEVIVRASGARVLLLDAAAQQRLSSGLSDALVVANLSARLPNAGHGPDDVEELDGPPATVAAEQVAALIYTSGTTGAPKGVMLSHYNLTSLVASLSPLFPLEGRDRLLSVLPLHHTFELTCGLLLPLSRGARVVYLDGVTRERVLDTLGEANISAMVGVPALWESLERQILARVQERGPVAGKLFEFGLAVSRTLGERLGADAGRLLFGTVHESLGGQLRLLVSGGAALRDSTHQLFAGLGLHLAEGYGLTEASPVVSVSHAGPKTRHGHVGRAIPGVEVKIDGPDAGGVGEVLVRGPNVMLGYADDEEATRAVLGDDGWLRTGDIGRLDSRRQLSIVGRRKEVIVPPSGENVYPDDVEAMLGKVRGVEELVVLGVSSDDGREVVALAAVAETDDAGEPRVAVAERALSQACAELPLAARPGLVRMLTTPLPRTSTRKVKRREVKRLLERALEVERAQDLSVAESDSDDARRAALAAISVIGRRAPDSLQSGQSLRGELGFDSLMSLELLVSLEAQLGRGVDSERLSRCLTVGDVVELAREAARARSAPPEAVERPQEETLTVPPAFRQAAMHWLGRAQHSFYQGLMSTRVLGRAFIPANRNTLVIANHASHLDMGLVKFALGGYGRDMVSLAAQDYFFEGGRYRRAYFENFTNLMPLSRSGSLRQSLRQAGEQLERGKVVLLFPEGTRSTTGELLEFKPLAAHLALHHGVDVLPLYLEGTFAALPKGAGGLRTRKLGVRIGPPLALSDMLRLTEGLSNVERTRLVTQLMQRSVEELSKGRTLDAATLRTDQVRGWVRAGAQAGSLSSVFSELEGRFVQGSVTAPVSYYFSLGSERWTVRVSRDSCCVEPGKAVDVADCVLKTSPSMFRRIVRDAYSPSASEFMSGQVKSNNIQLLMTFQKAFQLVPSAGGQ